MEALVAREHPLNASRPSALFIVAATLGVVLLGLGWPAGGQAPAPPTLTILSREGRRPVPLTVQNDQAFVALDDLAAAFQCTVREESLGALTVAYKGKTILLTPDQPVVSIGGRLVSLPAAPTRAGRRWLVPVEFINRALSLIYDARLELRSASRLVIVGDVRVPRVTVRFEGGDPSRLIMEATPRTTSTVTQETNTLMIKFDADALDVGIPPVQPGLVQAMRVVQPATLAIDLGPRFTGFRASTQTADTTARLTIDVMSAQTETQPVAPIQPSQPAPAPDLPGLGQPVASVRTIAIDPGHGGQDEGVKGGGGTKERDLVLGVARRLKAAIESRLGIRVLLTREDEGSVAPDNRAALANNNRADLFISLHANASFRKSMTGASILHVGLDHEAEQAARASLGSERLATFGGGIRDIDLVVWDLAQLRHVNQSAQLAKILDDQFRGRIPLAEHSLERAPLRVLESVNMPAVLIEMGYLTNDDQEKQMSGAEFQNAFVQAIYDGVVKFRDTLGAGGTR